MGQAITDYVKFLADARDAVYRLNCDQNTAGQLADEEEMKERELETARKAVSDSVNQTIKRRLDEINSSYDQEIGTGTSQEGKGETGEGQKPGGKGADCRGNQRAAGTQPGPEGPDEDNASEEPGACMVWNHFLLRSVLPQRGQGDYDFPSYPGNLLSGNSMRYLFYDSPEGYLVFGGGVFCGCHFVWRALCGDWQ